MGTLITTPSTATEYQARFACSMVLWERARHLINHDVPADRTVSALHGPRPGLPEVGRGRDIDDAVGQFARALRRVTREGVLAPGR
jgi:hypothetical protein